MREKLCFVVSMIIFGSVGIFAKLIALPAGEIAVVMSGIGSIFLAILLLVVRPFWLWISLRKNAFVLFFSGICLSGNWIFLFSAYQKTTIANAALSYYTAPIFVLLLSPLVNKEPLTRKKMLTVVFSFLGLVLIVFAGHHEHVGHWLGILDGFVAAIFYAALTLSHRFVVELDYLLDTFLQMMVATLILGLYLYLSGSWQGFVFWGKTGFLLILLGLMQTGLGFYLFFAGLRGLSSQTSAVLSYIDPLTSLGVSVFVFGQPIDLLQMAGAVLLLGSTFLSEVSLGAMYRRWLSRN